MHVQQQGPQGLHHTDVSASQPDLIKPRIDTLEYRFLTLPNSLRCLLISDPETEKAAAALDVRVGSMADPQQLPGLAHFLEHMLFYASHKYPTEDEYSKFISEHGGHTNAYTASEDTNYHFDVNADALAPALDRFAQFFINPTISEDGVDREANAVDSEHGKNLNSDPWKMLQLWKANSNPSHPFSKFSTGNLDTLIHTPKAQGIDVHTELRAFWEHHYSANLMQLVVYGQQSLDTLEQLVTGAFEPVLNRGLVPMDVPEDVVPPPLRGTLIQMVPEKDGHSVTFEWAVPPDWKAYRTGPCSYLGHFLGDEGQGSAFAYLKSKGWATALMAGESGNSFSSVSFFMVRVDLTDLGNQHVQEVGEVIFAYINLMKGNSSSGGGGNTTVTAKGIAAASPVSSFTAGAPGTPVTTNPSHPSTGVVTEARFAEYKALQALRFDFRDRSQPMSYASMLAHNMQLYAPGDLLLATYHVPLAYDAGVLTATLDALTPDNVRVLWASKTRAEETTQREAVYQTPYTAGKLPSAWLEAWTSRAAAGGGGSDIGEDMVANLALPPPNPFIPEDLSLVADPAPSNPSSVSPSPPSLLIDTPPSCRAWHVVDVSFSTPKAVVYVDVFCAEAYVTPEAAVYTRLVVKLLADYLNELTYPAELAGLYHWVSASTSGLTLYMTGYSEKMPTLLGFILDELAGFVVRPDRFTLVKEQLAKEYRNTRYQQPYQQAIYAASVLLEEQRWHVDQYESIIEDITADTVQTFFATRLFARAAINAYATGNLDKEKTMALLAQVQNTLFDETRLHAKPLFEAQWPQRRVQQVPQGRALLVSEEGSNEGNPNSAAIVLFQVGPDDFHTNLLLELFIHIAKRDAFHQLRTVEQLGYIVSVSSHAVLGVRHVLFLLQSNAHSAAHLDGRVEAFVQGLLQDKLQAMTHEQFKEYKSELRKAKLDAPKNLRQAAAREWWEVQEGTLVFGRAQREAAALEEEGVVTLEQLQGFAQAYVFDESTRRRLAVHVRRGGEVLEDGGVARDGLWTLKKSLSVF